MRRNKEMKLSIVLHSVKYILTAIFIALNLLGVVHWYWVWIVSPLLISLAVKAILLFILSFFVCTLPRWAERWDKE